MNNSQGNPEPLTFGGSMRAGAFTAQLFVKLIVNPTTLTISASGRTYQIDRENFLGLEETSIMGIFKRGLRFQHRQPDQPTTIIFYPTIQRVLLREKLRELGW